MTSNTVDGAFSDRCDYNSFKLYSLFKYIVSIVRYTSGIHRNHVTCDSKSTTGSKGQSIIHIIMYLGALVQHICVHSLNLWKVFPVPVYSNNRLEYIARVSGDVL